MLNAEKEFDFFDDCIDYFLPMSGSCWYYGTYGDFQIERNVDFIEQLVKDQNPEEKGYFIYIMRWEPMIL